MKSIKKNNNNKKISHKKSKGNIYTLNSDGIFPMRKLTSEYFYYKGKDEISYEIAELKKQGTPIRIIFSDIKNEDKTGEIIITIFIPFDILNNNSYKNLVFKVKQIINKLKIPRIDVNGNILENEYIIINDKHALNEEIIVGPVKYKNNKHYQKLHDKFKKILTDSGFDVE